MSKIELTDTPMDMLTKMSEGDPGALMAMMAIMQEHDAIDPQAAMGAIGAILLLDTWEIYGTEIYVLFSDKCNKDVRQLLMLMRATQLGIFSNAKLKEMAADKMRQVNLTDDEWVDIDSKVCDQLEEFKRAA